MIEQIPPTELRPNPLNEQIYSSESDEQFGPFRETVKKHGILQNLVATPDRKLIAGHRRLRAAIELGFQSVPVKFQEFESEDAEIVALVDANHQRTKTYSERMKEADVLEPAMAAIGRQRMSEGGRRGGQSRNGQGSGQLANPSNGHSTRATVAQRIGLSEGQYRRERKLWSAHQADEPLISPEVVAKLDQGSISVHGAMKKLNAAKASKARSNGEVDDLADMICPFDCDDEADADGGSPPGQAFVNIVHYFSDEGDLVLDPMAGNGIVHRVCELMGRQSACFDLTPRKPYIDSHDITDGLPPLEASPSLIILDPPYSNQRIYSDHPNDLSHIESSDDFLSALEQIIQQSFAALQTDGRLHL